MRGEKMIKTGTTGKGSRTISKREQRAIDSGENLQRRIVNTTIHCITDIKVLIHASIFSGIYKLGTLKKMLGFGVPADASFEEYGRYSFKRDVQLDTGKLKLFFKFPNEGYGPSCLIINSKSPYSHLSNIYKRLPKLKITRLEYAIDLFCRSPEAVADVLYLIRRYLYAPNAWKTSMSGGKFLGYKEYGRVINAVYFIWMGKSSGKHIKVYERGDDKKKIRSIRGHPKWRHEDVNRVRIEFKLKRTAIVKKYGLSTLKDLIINPKFGIIAKDYVQFNNFKFSSKLPQDYDDYLSEDKQGNPESFMQEVLSAKDRDIKNIMQYVEDNKRMQTLKNRIIEAAKAFDKNWRKGCRRVV